MEVIGFLASIVGVAIALFSRTDKHLREIRDILIEIRDQAPRWDDEP